MFSRLVFYYQIKLAVVVWLTLFEGANAAYHRVRTFRYRIAHSRLFRKRIVPIMVAVGRGWRSVANKGGFGAACDDIDTSFEARNRLVEQDVLLELEEQAELSALAKVSAAARIDGVKEACRNAVRGDYGRDAQRASLAWLEQREYAFLYARVHSAKVTRRTRWHSTAECGKGTIDDDVLLNGHRHARDGPTSAEYGQHVDASKVGAHAMHRSSDLALDTTTPSSSAGFALGHKPIFDCRGPPRSADESEREPSVVFFDKHNQMSKQVSPSSHFYCVLHLISSDPQSPGHSPRKRNVPFPSLASILSASNATGDNGLRWHHRFSGFFADVYAYIRSHTFIEILIGGLEEESLRTARTSAVRREPFCPTWQEDVELRLVGGTVDPATGRFHNPRTPRTDLLVQLWIADMFQLDSLVGETAIPLADIMHGIPTRFNDMPLFDDEGILVRAGDDDVDAEGASATLSITLVLSAH